MRRLLLAAVLVAACTPAAAPAPLTLHAGDPGATNLPAGRYRFAWTAPGCTYLDVRWSPSSGAETIVVKTSDAAAAAAGSATVELAGGAAYVNRSADCDYTLEVAPAR